MILFSFSDIRYSLSIFTIEYVLTKNIILLNQMRKGPSMLGLLREIEKYPHTCLALYLFTKVAKWQQLVLRNCSMTLHLSYMVQTLIILLLATNFQKCRDVYLLSATMSKTSMIAYRLWQEVAHCPCCVKVSFIARRMLFMHVHLFTGTWDSNTFQHPKQSQYVNEKSDESQQFEYSLRSICYFPTSFLFFFMVFG